MNRLLRSCALLAALVFAASDQDSAVRAAEPAAAAHPDFSGVWLPNSKASGRWPTERPFNKRMQDLRAQWARATGTIDLVRDDDYISCMPYSLPYMLSTITQYPFEIVMSPRRVYVFTETYGQVRRIDMDAPPASPETLPSRTGTSRGHWEGSQLVIETTGLFAENEGHRYPSSPALRVTERLSLEQGAAGRQLINEITFHDPLVYDAPINLRMVFKAAAPGIEVGEYICQQDLWDQHLDGSTSRIPWR